MLVERSQLLSKGSAHYYLFAKTGFTAGCLNQAKEMGNVSLVTYKEILNTLIGKTRNS